MLVASACFSVMAVMARIANETFDWRMVTAVRAAVMLVVAVALLAAARTRFQFIRPPILLLRSASGTAALCLSFFALTREDVPLSDSITLFHLMPIWLTLLSWPVLGRRPSLGTWAAVASGVAGVALIAQPHLAEGRLGAMAALASSFFSAVSMIGLNRLGGTDPRVVVGHFAATATLATGALVVASGSVVQPGAEVATVAILVLIGAGLIGTAGQVSMTRAYASGQPSWVAVVGLTQIIFGAVADALFWDRTFNLMTIVGMILVAAPAGWLLAGGGRSK